MFKTITHELKDHAAFTALGTVGGVAILLGMVYAGLGRPVSLRLFEVAHPLHVLLSAIVTTAMYRLHRRGSVAAAILVGYVGAVGIGTLSDCLIPYLGELLLGLPHAAPHVGFIEEWYLVNPAAAVGIAIGYFWPHTKLPHSGHVLLSTAASLFHITMAVGAAVSAVQVILIAVFLFLAVWVPCCTSDIVFPLLLPARTKH